MFPTIVVTLSATYLVAALNLHPVHHLAARQGEWQVTTANALSQSALTSNAELKLVHMPDCNSTASGDDSAYPVVTHPSSGTTFWREYSHAAGVVV